MAPPRRRDTTTETIPSMLAQVDRYLLSIDGGNRDGTEDAAQILDCHMVYTFISPEGGVRVGVERDQLEGKTDGWPCVGKYEADYVDSNDVSVLPEPWTAVQFDPDALKELAKGRQHGGGGHDSIGSLVEELLSSARIETRNARARAEAAERRADLAREETNRKVDTINRLQREKNDALMQAEKANAGEALAKARQLEAEENLERIENEIAEFKPHIQAGVDQMVHHIKAAFGDGDMMLPGAASQANGGNGAHANGSAGPQPAGDEDADPRPPLAEDPLACGDELLEAVVLDAEVARELHKMGILRWELIRAVIWMKTKRDLGPDPVWGDETEAPPQRAERRNGAPTADAGGP